ncbi:pimeloyl-ACP methyl ester carboxylesterase [Parabacteroides sp. PFB2-12]|uniref:alpha/beta hydrolase family protein n=1 Tax=unclassified Parabacteroides TaxID=2649774 RepID=UPI002476687C|nr:MULTISPECIES: alpha/beta fold hydrolase [unclassified Parabacteroides]MDH6342015.1 pimeloyl-ACP methyl ester carboxylesterase [Parabacteroides sp. PM6-13]MDH6389713.1 pimeloyl-ACP methyl ester carboxylesterase [Parabacteroides sp. PFB2-12]
MKKVYVWLLCSLFVLASASASAQDITGNWYGRADVGGMKLRMNLTFEKSGETYTGYMVSPDQSSAKIPFNKITFEANRLSLEIAQIGFKYQGVWKEDNTIDGSFTQMGAQFPIKFSREEIVANRPQHPVPPYPYLTEEITFRNEKANVRLAGTITLPKQAGKYPAVVLVTGSGPQNRDEELMGHKPFWVIADYLTRQGIVVLRYDERGVGASEGKYNECGIPDFAEDAAAAIAYLKNRKEVDKQKIGIIGHSEGGSVATLLAAQQIPAFIVSLAGPGENGRDLMQKQRAALFKTSGATDAYINRYNETMTKLEDYILTTDKNAVKKESITAIIAGTVLAGQEQTIIAQMTSESMLTLLRFDPLDYFKKITCPVLALNGDKDLQVIARPNLEGFKQITANGNNQVTIKEYPGLNHLFQHATTGLPAEYSQIEETISPEVLKDMGEWILKQ